jgi:long-subunit acyl-CoA synthetase (AMP-forming)
MNDEVVDIGVDGEVQYKSSSVLKTYRKKEDLYNKLMTSDGYARTG